MGDNNLCWPSYLPRVPEELVVEGHGDGVDDARPAVEALGGEDAVDLLLFLPQLGLLLLHARVPALLVALVVPDVEGVHEREAAGGVLDRALVLLLAEDALFEAADVLREGLDVLELAGGGGGVGAGGELEAGAVEAVHAGEDVELLAEEGLEALLALVAGVDLDAAVLDHAQLVLELLRVGRVAVHQRLQPPDLRRVALQRLADLVLEVLDLDVLVEVRQQILDLHHLRLLGQLDHLADAPFLMRQCFAISIHSFLRSSSYSGLSAYFLASSSLLCSRASATASPQRYILPQTMICASAILQLRNSRSPKSRSNSSRPLSISSISSACFSLGLVAQKKMRMLCRLRSRLFSSSTQYRSSSIPCTRLWSGMFIRPGISLIGLNSRTDLVSSCTVFSVSQRKKMCAYLQTTSTTLGSLTFLRYSSAFSQASSLRQCITIISKLFFLSAKFIRFWMRPCDCITRYTSSSFTTFRFFSSSSSSSRCFSFSFSPRLPASPAPPSFSRSARSSRFSRQIISSISHDTSRQRWLFSSGLSRPSQVLRYSSSPSLASSELTCRNLRKISSKVREVSLKQRAARSYWRLAKRWSAQMPATQETFSFLALQTAQASLYFFSSSSSFQASLPSLVVSSLMTPLLEKIQKMPVERSQAMSDTSDPLNSSCTTSFWVMLLTMEMLSWKSRQQWKSVTPMLIGVSCTWQALASGRSARLAHRSASFLARKESLTASSGSGTRIRTMLLLLTHRMEVGRLSSFEQQTWFMDWQLLGICTSFSRSVWLRQLWMRGSRSSGPVKETSEELVKRMTTTQLRLLACVSRSTSREVTSLLRQSWYCSTFCSRTSPFCSRSMRQSTRMPPSMAISTSPDLVSLIAPWNPMALMLTPFSSLRILTLLSRQLRQQLMPPSPAMMQCHPRGSMQMLRTFADRSLVLISPRKFSLLVSGSSYALNSASTFVRHRYSLFDSVTRIFVSSLTTSFLMRSVFGSPGSSVFLKMKTSSSICWRGSKPCSSTSSPSFMSSPRSRQPYSYSQSESCWPFLEYISQLLKVIKYGHLLYRIT